jgi:dolichyl-phosphate-mannose--protein O-mannosyl transferase
MRAIRERMNLIGILLFSSILRLWNLGSPKGFIFDEVYYVDGARDYLKYFVEMDKSKAEFIVHPPIGKWLIAFGIKVFGDHEFGWRIAGAAIGVASVYLIYRAARTLFQSEFLALSAALLTSLDGLHLVMSRTALLDIFLMFFILLAFNFLLEKRYWLLGISLGLACATKWSALYYAVAFIAVVIVQEIKRIKMFTENAPSLRKLITQRISQLVLLPSALYIGSWSGWFFTKTGWDRNWSKNPFISLWHYHIEMLNFHTGLTEAHSYSANPWSWLILGRPTSFFYNSPKCDAANCSQEILALGTPFIWWSATIALGVLIGYVVSQRDKRGALILLGVAAGYLPWFAFQQRTVFSFYSIVFEPFIILTLTYMIGLLHQRYKTFIYGFFIAVALCFLYFLPIYIAQTMTYNEWHARMWFSSWI